MPNTMMAAAAAVALRHAAAQPLPSVAATTTYHRAMVGGVGIFYREAGARDAPTILLPHGYPSSSRQWDPLLPLLAERYHVVAPDYPGFGQSHAPSPAQYSYTFDNLAATMEGLVAHLGIGRYTLFMQDYGGPVGFRMAQAHPEKVTALIVQNANAYAEGLGVKWQGIAKYWADPAAHPEQLDAFMSFETAKQRHLGTSPNLDRYNPDTCTDEHAILACPGERDIQASLPLRLPHERRVLSGVAGLDARPPVTNARALGSLRPLLPRAGSRGLPSRYAEGGTARSRRRSLRAGRGN